MSLKDTLSAKEKNTRKHITFSLPIKKQTENSKTITYKIKFIDSIGFMASLRSSVTDNLV